MIVMEEWRAIDGYEGLFEVSNLGNVRSIDKHDRNGRFWEGKTLSKNVVSSGYLRVVLCANNNSKHVYVHRLVADAFIPNPDSKPQVNHKDGNKQNNIVETLEWVTHGENIKHSFDVLGRPRPKGCRGWKNPRRLFSDEQVRAIRNDPRSNYAIAKELGVNDETIRLMRVGKTYKHVDDDNYTNR